MSIWQIVAWAVPTLGVVGTIALFVLSPTIASTIFKGIAKLIQTELSYRLGCAITAAIITGFAVDYWRHSRDDAAFAERTAAFEQAQTERDTRIAKETRAEVWRQIADATAENADIDKQVEDFTNARPAIPANDPCSISPADRDRLRHIAGETVSRSRPGIARVPKARSAPAHP